MALVKRNGHFEVVWNDAGSGVKGIAVHSHLFTEDGDFVRTIVESPSSVDDHVIKALAAQCSADVVAQRDALLGELDTITRQYAELQTAKDALQAQLDAILRPPINNRHLPPFTFLALFKDEEVYAALTSTDPIIVVALAKLQTIITFVDLDLPDTVNLVGYMEASGIIAPGRAAKILAGESPS